MKKRDKTKGYIMNLPKEIMPRRKKKEMYQALTKAALKAAIKEIYNKIPPTN